MTARNTAKYLQNSENSISSMACSACHIGMMQKEMVTYFTWLDEELITVPDFPAWTCDICGHREYDMQALDNLALLLCPANAPEVYGTATQPVARQDKTVLPQQPSTNK